MTKSTNSPTSSTEHFIDPNAATQSALPDTAFDYDVAIIGAGMSGLYQLYRLRKLGLRVRVFEAGSDVGGTWYWNRYPGARFDSESYSYGYSFSEEILNEWDWSEHFSSQPEIERYIHFVCSKFSLREQIQFNSRLKSASYQNELQGWQLCFDHGETCTARLFITAIGLLSAPTLPNFPRMDEFGGISCHTNLWPKQPIDFSGKRVAVIGTGASGVQAIQEIAKDAGSLTVFQRRPNWCTPLNNAPIGNAEMRQIRAGYPALFELCLQTTACFIHNVDPRATFEVSEDERNAFWEQRYAGRGFGIWQGNFRDMLTDPAANKLMSDFVADKIRARVREPKVAEMLIPTDHGFGTRRVPQETHYYEVYNQHNVSLVSMLDTPIEKITPRGLTTTAASYEFDNIIYATGFDAITGSFDRIQITGKSGAPLTQRWRDGPQTFVGVSIDDFPNMFMLMGPHAALGNNPRSIEYNVDWITGLVEHMLHNSVAIADVRPQAVASWAKFVHEKAQGLLTNEVDSWMTGVNMNVAGRQQRRVVRYSGTAPEYRAHCNAVAANGYQEYQFS